MKLIIRYFRDVDFLTLWNGRQSDGGEDVSAGLTAFFDDSDDSVVSFTIQSAVKDLAPVLYGKESADGNPVRLKVGQLGYPEDDPLLIDYVPESDTLRLLERAAGGQNAGCCRHPGRRVRREGELVGFTLKQTARQLRPFLSVEPHLTGR